MCVTKNLPTVISFLILYPLRCGCVTILLWTTFRTLLCLFFFMVGSAEVFLLRAAFFGYKLFSHEEALPDAELLLLVFYPCILMVAVESVILVHTIYLAVGLYNYWSQSIGLYLICRFFTLLFEFVLLIVLCLAHKALIGWYLGFLMFVVLEFYSLVVVYSYYVDIKEEEDREKIHFQP